MNQCSAPLDGHRKDSTRRACPECGPSLPPSLRVATLAPRLSSGGDSPYEHPAARKALEFGRSVCPMLTVVHWDHSYGGLPMVQFSCEHGGGTNGIYGGVSAFCRDHGMDPPNSPMALVASLNLPVDVKGLDRTSTAITNGVRTSIDAVKYHFMMLGIDENNTRAHEMLRAESEWWLIDEQSEAFLLAKDLFPNIA